MQKSRTTLMLLMLMIAMLISAGAISAQDEPAMADVEGAVFEISVYRVLDVNNFTTLSAELTTMLSGMEGVIASQTYNTFFAIPDMAEGETYAVRITEWASLSSYTAITEIFDNETVETVQNIVVQPFVKGEALHVNDLVAPGQVLEIAFRDISAYDDPVDFLRTIQGFTHQLTALDGVVREYEWLSVDGQYFVGMTQYESLDAFMAASQNEALLTSPVTAAVFTQYPPILAQMTLPASE
jgi:hypothetical protein